MRKQRKQSKATPETDNFDSSAVEAAWTYYLRASGGHPKGHVPNELIAAFIAGACWAKQLLKLDGQGG
jgi:hypothetical protein